MGELLRAQFDVALMKDYACLYCLGDVSTSSHRCLRCGLDWSEYCDEVNETDRIIHYLMGVQDEFIPHFQRSEQ